VTLTFDLLTLKVVSESSVTWAISLPILVFLGLSVLELRRMYATDRRRTDIRRQTKALINAPPIMGGVIIIIMPQRISIEHERKGPSGSSCIQSGSGEKH